MHSATCRLVIHWKCSCVSLFIQRRSLLLLADDECQIVLPEWRHGRHTDRHSGRSNPSFPVALGHVQHSAGRCQRTHTHTLFDHPSLQVDLWSPDFLLLTDGSDKGDDNTHTHTHRRPHKDLYYSITGECQWVCVSGLMNEGCRLFSVNRRDSSSSVRLHLSDPSSPRFSARQHHNIISQTTQTENSVFCLVLSNQ